jgi:ribonuclease HI
VIAAKCLSVCGRQEPVKAEAQAALGAVDFSCDFGLQSIILKGDSLQVVNVVNANGPNWCRYGQLMASST